MGYNIVAEQLGQNKDSKFLIFYCYFLVFIDIMSDVANFMCYFVLYRKDVVPWINLLFLQQLA